MMMTTVLSVLLAGILAQGAMAAVQTGIAEVNGTKLYYEMAGSGRVIILLHGGAVDRRAWDDQFTEFAAKYKVIRYDLRGAGKSAKLELLPMHPANDPARGVGFRPFTTIEEGVARFNIVTIQNLSPGRRP